MAIQEVLSALRSPWQRAYVERVIGTIRRECLDHVIVFNEASLYRHVKSFVTYYHESLEPERQGKVCYIMRDSVSLQSARHAGHVACAVSRAEVISSLQ